MNSWQETQALVPKYSMHQSVKILRGTESEKIGTITAITPANVSNTWMYHVEFGINDSRPYYENEIQSIPPSSIPQQA